ncbi:hypothetical protein SRHO_G00144020 [Serrasalmus rhombeus]
MALKKLCLGYFGTVVIHVGVDDISSCQSEVLKVHFRLLLDTVKKRTNARIIISRLLPTYRRGSKLFSRLYALYCWLQSWWKTTVSATCATRMFSGSNSTCSRQRMTDTSRSGEKKRHKECESLIVSLRRGPGDISGSRRGEVRDGRGEKGCSKLPWSRKRRERCSSPPGNWDWRLEGWCEGGLRKLLQVLFSILDDSLQLLPAGQVQVAQGLDGLFFCWGDSLDVLPSFSWVSAPL